MKKRLKLDLFFDDLTNAEMAALKSLKAKSVSVKDELSFANVHECGHGSGKKCKLAEDL